VVSTHEPEQSVSPVLHVAEQTPDEHFGVAPEHAVVHAPQWAGSVNRSTQVVPHSVSPAPGHSVPPSAASLVSAALVSRVSAASVASFASPVASPCPLSLTVESSITPVS
jgi:hypothetical protein